MSVFLAQTKHKLLKGKYARLTILEYSHRIKYTNSFHYFYKCKCDCGNITIVNSSQLVTGKTKSCGCLAKELQSKGKGEASFNYIYGSYKENARRRNLIFELSKDKFKTLIDSNCYYCKKPPSNLRISIYSTGSYIYNGIDRLDNNLGYIDNNCVTCCKQCNIAKHTYNLEEFKNWIKEVYTNLYEVDESY